MKIPPTLKGDAASLTRADQPIKQVKPMLEAPK